MKDMTTTTQYTPEFEQTVLDIKTAREAIFEFKLKKFREEHGQWVSDRENQLFLLDLYEALEPFNNLLWSLYQNAVPITTIRMPLECLFIQPKVDIEEEV